MARAYLLYAATQVESVSDRTNTAKQQYDARRQERSECGQIREVRTTERTLQELPRKRAEDRIR